MFGGRSTSGTSVTVLHTLPSGAFWGATPDGCLARFAERSCDASLIRASSEASLELTPERLLSPRAALAFTVQTLKIDESETKAVLAGYSDGRPHLCVVSLERERAAKGQVESYVPRCCQGDFIFHRPGMNVRQVEWWPRSSPPCFIVLAGNCLAVYNSLSIPVPLVTYRLQSSPVMAGCSIADGGSPVAFCFLDNHRDWGAFALCLLRDDGALFALCPVAAPGLQFSREEVSNLLADETGRLAQSWHHQVFSRTQLMEMERSGRDATSVIQTRFPSNGWKHAPCLQGPLGKISPQPERSYLSLMYLGGGRLAMTSARGRMQFVMVSHIRPMFHEKENRSGAPHVLHLQDCRRSETAAQRQTISEALLPVSEATVQSVMQRRGHPDIVAVTDEAIVHVDFSSMSNPLVVRYPNQRGAAVGCLFSGEFLLSVHVLSRLQLQCHVLENEQTDEYRSRLQSLSVHDIEPSHIAVGKSDMELLDIVSDLQEELKTLCTEHAAVCEVHEGSQAEAGSFEELKSLEEALKACHVPGGVLLDGRYVKALRQILDNLQGRYPRDASTSTKIQYVEKCLREMGFEV